MESANRGALADDVFLSTSTRHYAYCTNAGKIKREHFLGKIAFVFQCGTASEVDAGAKIFIAL
jgi:hypothetical protein